MRMKQMNLAVKPIFEMQIDMLYRLFRDNYSIPEMVLKAIFSSEISKYCFWFTSETNTNTLETYAVKPRYDDTTVYPIISQIEDDDEKPAVDSFCAMLYGVNSDEWVLERVWEESFTMDTSKWRLDKFEKAILLNTDSFWSIAMVLYDVWIQINDKSNLKKIIEIGSFNHVEKNTFQYQIFSDTIGRYLQNVYTGFDLTVRDCWIIGPSKFVKNSFNVFKALRSMEDQLGFEHLGIPKQIFPAVLPDFKVQCGQ